MLTNVYESSADKKWIKSEVLPREKLSLIGAANLSDQELLSIMLGTGVSGKPVHIVAKDLVRLIDSAGDSLEISALCKVVGVGPAKSTQIIAALEFCRRRFHSHHTKIRTAHDILPLVSHLADRKQEHLISITLNGAHEVITSRIVCVGTANSAIAHPREIFTGAITDSACAIVIAHNHPSGNVEPSEEDKVVTKRTAEAGSILGIPLLDHIIFCRDALFSFQEHNIF